MMRVCRGSAVLGVLMMAASVPVHAGFLDERSPASKGQDVPDGVVSASASSPSVPVAKADLKEASKEAAKDKSVGGLVHGAFTHPGWNELAPSGTVARPLVTAFAALLPPSHPSVSIQGPDDLLDEMVTWKPGATRVEALRQIAKAYGIDFTLQTSSPGSNLVVSKSASAGSGVESIVAVGRWEILPTDTKLATALERWSRQAGYSFRWDAGRHAQIEGAHTFVGTFESAIKGALDTPGIANSAYPLESCIYPNNPLLLRITRKGEQAKDCPITE